MPTPMLVASHHRFAVLPPIATSYTSFLASSAPICLRSNYQHWQLFVCNISGSIQLSVLIPNFSGSNLGTVVQARLLALRLISEPMQSAPPCGSGKFRAKLVGMALTETGNMLDMVPPKDPYIKVRVLDDIGSVALSDQMANLAYHAILFLRRTDAETYISQGLMEELTD